MGIQLAHVARGRFAVALLLPAVLLGSVVAAIGLAELWKGADGTLPLFPALELLAWLLAPAAAAVAGRITGSSAAGWRITLILAVLVGVAAALWVGNYILSARCSPFTGLGEIAPGAVILGVAAASAFGISAWVGAWLISELENRRWSVAAGLGAALAMSILMLFVLVEIYFIALPSSVGTC